MWLSSQRRFVWEEGDIVIIRRGEGKRPEEDDEAPDDGGKSPGR